MYLLLIFFLALIAASSCSSAEESQTSSDIQSFAAEGAMGSQEGRIPVIGGDAREQKGGRATLAEGAATVLGLGIPKGMVPAAGPHRVYRFEGIFPVEQVKSFIQRQVRVKKVEEEGSGYLMRWAKVKKPKGRSAGDQLLAIRVFKGRRGGATVDVWLERESPIRAPHSGNALKRSSSTATPTPRRVTRSTMAKRGKSMQDTLRVMDKTLRGDKLDSKELDSPFLD